MKKLRQNPAAYSLPQRILHWLSALLVFYNLLLPDGMSEWQQAIEHTGSATDAQLAGANLHAYVGISILLLISIRLVLRFIQGTPSAPAEEPYVLTFAAKGAHATLYLLLFALPISGMAAFYFGYDRMGEIHAEVLKVILWIVIAAHILGALAHQFYWKTNVLRRMTVG
jgi:cytochrome b561